MAAKRFVHTQTRLADGRVLCVSGINGATNILGQDAPTFTATCNIYDPATNSVRRGGEHPDGAGPRTAPR